MNRTKAYIALYRGDGSMAIRIFYNRILPPPSPDLIRLLEGPLVCNQMVPAEDVSASWDVEQVGWMVGN